MIDSVTNSKQKIIIKFSSSLSDVDIVGSDILISKVDSNKPELKLKLKWFEKLKTLNDFFCNDFSLSPWFFRDIFTNYRQVSVKISSMISVTDIRQSQLNKYYFLSELDEALTATGGLVMFWSQCLSSFSVVSDLAQTGYQRLLRRLSITVGP